eukprot:scaffold42517_cov57-Phaeocystis_antarctica.AAC.1
MTGHDRQDRQAAGAVAGGPTPTAGREQAAHGRGTAGATGATGATGAGAATLPRRRHAATPPGRRGPPGHSGLPWAAGRAPQGPTLTRAQP